MHATSHPSCLLNVQGMRITAEAAALMPQAFPHLTALQLRHCEMDTVALLAALRTCQHLSSLALEEPRHTDPAGLWAAGITEAEGAGHAPVMHDTVEEVIGSADASAVEEATEAAQCAAAVGKLLGSLQQLTALSLMMPCVPVAMKLLALGSGPWCSLQELSLREASGDSPMTEQSATKLALPALLACTSLTSLELRFKITHPSVMALVESPAMQGLRSLRLPQQWVNQKLLDLLLKCLPGGAVCHLARAIQQGKCPPLMSAIKGCRCMPPSAISLALCALVQSTATEP